MEGESVAHCYGILVIFSTSSAFSYEHVNCQEASVQTSCLFKLKNKLLEGTLLQSHGTVCMHSFLSRKAGFED